MTQDALAAFNSHLKIISGVDATGLVVQVSTFESPVMAGIRELRMTEYRNRGVNYLYEAPADVQERNDALDRRSRHLSVWSGGELMGAVRLTAAPFELVEETGTAWVHGEFGGHMEFGRLVMAGAANYRTAAEALTAAGCLSALEAGKQGVIAMCRPVQARLFERYGLKPITASPAVLPQRNGGRYWLMAAAWADMAVPIARIAAQLADRIENQPCIAVQA